MTIFTGTKGDDSILGTSGGDDFHLEQGGEDSADGGAGLDAFYMGASFDAGDRIDGGGGTDYLLLKGDYSAGVALTASTITHMERIQVAAGYSYVLTGLSDANIGGQMIIDATALHKGQGLTLEASAVTSGLVVTGGAGADDFIGGSGADTLSGGGGHNTLDGGAGNDRLILGDHAEVIRGGAGDDVITDDGALGFNARDKIDGGDGMDTLIISSASGAGAAAFTDKSMRNIEHLVLMGDSITVKLADGNVAAGETLQVEGGSVGRFQFDGSAEKDGAFDIDASSLGASTIRGGRGDDFIHGYVGHMLVFGLGGNDGLLGGSLSDTLDGGAGDDTISGGKGNDVITGGLGADTLDGGARPDIFVYGSVQDSTAASTDLIQGGLGLKETIDLHAIDADTTTDGDQAFHLVSAFSGLAGELNVSYDSLRHQTVISGDVDGDGTADLVIDAAGDHHDFTDFVL